MLVYLLRSKAGRWMVGYWAPHWRQRSPGCTQTATQTWAETSWCSSDCSNPDCRTESRDDMLTPDHFSRWNMVSDSLMGVFGKHSGSAARSYRSCRESRAGSLLDLTKYTFKHWLLSIFVISCHLNNTCLFFITIQFTSASLSNFRLSWNLIYWFV